jgi:hypothetical protein
VTHIEEIERKAHKILGPRAVCLRLQRECAIGVRNPGCGVTLMRGSVSVKARGATWLEALADLETKVIAELDKKEADGG